MKIFKKALIILIIVQVIVLVGLIVNVVFSYYDNQIDIIEKNDELLTIIEDTKIEENILPDEEIDMSLVKEDMIYQEEQKKEEIYNIVLVGMDARGSETRSRSDSIILLSYNNLSHTVKMISFLRDTWVYLPERGYGRINTATAYGGVGLLINTINENFDLDVQNYVQIKFDDFKKVIDILGGVDVELTKSEINYINNKLHVEDRDWNNDITDPPGLIHLNGAQTLWHCRNRTIGEGDFSRTDRQRDVLGLIMDKAMNMSVTQLTSLVYEMKDYVDMNVPITTLIEVAEDAIISKELIIESYRIPFDGLYWFANKNGASVLDINRYETAVKLHEILGLDVENIEIPPADTRVYNVPKVETTENTETIETIENTESSEVVENTDGVEITDSNESIENLENLEGLEGSDNSEIVEDTENGELEDNLENVDNEDDLDNPDNVDTESDLENNDENLNNIEDSDNTDNISNSEFVDNTDNLENTENTEVSENIDDVENVDSSENIGNSEYVENNNDVT